MMLGPDITERVYRVGHMCCGIGAGAKGFNDARFRVGNLRGRFECAGGIDVDAKGLVAFEQLTGVKGTVLDLFDREQYLAFHGKEPPAPWREATPDDIWRAYGSRPIDVLFASMPCKGFSGLLSTAASGTEKYQALNRLTVRGIMLALEAFRPRRLPRLIIFENVPRIATRGRPLLNKIKALLRADGYVIVETEHDCGELGGLGQSRRRFLMVARLPDSVPNYLYEPEKKRLRGVGEIIGKLPLPADAIAGPMHRVPELMWKTWVRLAFVPAGRDWRALNELVVENGQLRDFGILPEQALHNGDYGVAGWHDTAGTVTGARAPGQGRFSVADIRSPTEWHNEALGVRRWEDEARVVAGASRPHNGAHSVAYPRYAARDRASTLGVREWNNAAGTVQGESYPTNGSFSVADPRVVNGHPRSVQLGVGHWEQPAAVVKGDVSVGTGRYAVPDPRILGRPRFNNCFRVVRFGDAAPAVSGPGGAGGMAVGDPRPAASDYSSRKYRVTPYDAASRTVIGASTTGDGAFAVADPRGGADPAKLHGCWRVEDWERASKAVIGGNKNGAAAVADPRPTHGPNAHTNKMRVVSADQPAPSVIGSDRVGSGALSVADPRTGYPPGTHQNILAVVDASDPSKSVTGAKHPAGGALSVADPRPVGLNAEARDTYASQGHYGVQRWEDTSVAVPGYAKYDRGKWSVADPRDQDQPEPIAELPKPNQQLVARIVAEDGTWHRPFTTLELAALQSIFDPEECFGWSAERGWFSRKAFDLPGVSDATKREWIGNAVPSESARAIAEEMGQTLLLADTGETFTLSSKAIWCRPISFALAIDPRQEIYGERLS